MNITILIKARYNAGIYRFHGTSHFSANKILKQGFKNKTYRITVAPQNQQQPGNLGSGIYGYINREGNNKKSRDNARKFAEKFDDDDVAIIRFLTNVKKNHTLDMDKPSNREIINDFLETKEYKYAIQAYNMTKGSKNRRVLIRPLKA